ncbi:hypothetical protein [Streptomyces sp. NPDC057623]|uniref:hypothetical protein n=1 Tax=Streptomyces sp. NPDC057623 TaxID=3346187 RepID=UPI00367B75A8
MRGVGIHLSSPMRNGIGAALLSLALVAMNAETAMAEQPATLPGELVGSWITEDKSSYAEFESDWTYVYKEGNYTEVGEFEIQGKTIQYSPKVALEKQDEQSLPAPYSETWSVERGDDGIDELTTNGESVSLLYSEMTIGNCA